ncbi:TRAP transporter substrate-binding protein [Aquibacillus sediminis]|uniref:TRAP transporter substrate-binding protein n=1 Tax=Aquibacillus sediminis TaxID=2574734 RepID=UPI001109D8DC|nr:TRAP transporter substrate-binding protein [Aquibacillus sediminis]
MRKSLLFLISMLAFLMVLTACVESQQSAGDDGDQSSSGSEGTSNEEASGEGRTYEFNLSHVTPPSHNWQKTAEKFGEELETLSDGRMELEIFPNGQLGSEGDMIQQIETGTLSFGIITNAYLSNRIDSLNGWFMPFLFDDLEEANAAKETEMAQQFLDDVTNDSMLAIDFAFAGNRHILMTEGEVTSPEDIEGKKMRIIGSPAMQDFWVESGASPTPMPLPDVYTSLQNGVIDGIDIDLDALVSLKLHEIAQDLTLTNHMSFPSVVVMSKQVRAELPEEDLQIVDEALESAIEWGIQDQIQREQDNLAFLEENGMNITEFDNHDTFLDIIDSVYTNYGDENEAIQALIEEYQD